MNLFRIAAAALLALGLAGCASTTETAATNGAATGAASPLDPSSVEYFQAVVGDRVFFATDSSTLSPEAQDTLRRQAEWLNENSVRTAVIEGHADERGTRDYNLGLGARRAAAVFNFLVGEGVANFRLDTVTYGKERPEATCSNESCWSQNRRAVTRMISKPVS